MKIHVEQLTPEEIELIQQHRKKQKTLVLTHEVEDTGYCYEFKEMRFSIEDKEGVVHLKTKKQKNLDGKFYSSSGFFQSDLTKEDAKRLRDFLDVFLQQTNPTV